MRRWGLGKAMTVGVVAVLLVGLVAVLASLGYAARDASSSGRAPRPEVAVEGFAPDAARDSAAGPLLEAPAAAPAPDAPVGSVVQSALIRTAQVTVEVADPAVAARQLRTAAAAAGGFVAEEQTDPRGAFVVLRVPADGLDRFVEQVGGFGKVLETSSQVTDVTEEVVDLDARVASQRASVERVRALLAQATSIGDVVAVESELARREAELDSLTSRLTVLREQVAMSTLTVDLRAVATEDVDEQAGGFAGGLGAGWDGLRAVGGALAAVVGFVLPFLPVLAVLVGLGWLVRRLVRARRGSAVAPATPATPGGPAGP